ncbi:MAG TPA: type II toxin-antitoxin system VapC family toxin [Caulobacteraceae bacterium]|nr:type II toxin-antitoxin system VapC family toxin [Caulobacteraceae bacterium]
MSDAVLDSSALLALLLAEPGAEVVMAALPGALLSAVNLAEIVAQLGERGMAAREARAVAEATGIDVVDFTAEQAMVCGELRKSTKSRGLSLGGRACLALARARGLPAITADRAWAGLTGLDVVVIRDPH